MSVDWPRTLNEKRDWWRERVKHYSEDGEIFYAATERPHPKPLKVDHLFSGCFIAGGTRYWAFRHRTRRNVFCQAYHALQCGNPCP